jgi:hypothetical protein
MGGVEVLLHTLLTSALDEGDWEIQAAATLSLRKKFLVQIK